MTDPYFDKPDRRPLVSTGAAGWLCGAVVVVTLGVLFHLHPEEGMRVLGGLAFVVVGVTALWTVR